MKQTNNTHVLLAVLLLLLAVKFALLPVLAWQNQLIEQAQRIELRNQKAQDLLQRQQQLTDQLSRQTEQLKLLQQRYPVFAQATEFRLQSQMDFENLIKQFKLRKKQFFWRGDNDELLTDSLAMGVFNVTITGTSKQLALLHAELSTKYTQFRVRNMRFNIRRQKVDSLGLITATITVEALYWQGEVS